MFCAGPNIGKGGFRSVGVKKTGWHLDGSKNGCGKLAGDCNSIMGGMASIWLRGGLDGGVWELELRVCC